MSTILPISSRPEGGSSGQQPQVSKQTVPVGAVMASCREATRRDHSSEKTQQAQIKATDEPKNVGPYMAVRQLPPEPKDQV